MVHLRHRNLLQTMAATIFPLFYRRRAARKRYFRVLSSPRGAETIFLPFYRHRAAREQYFCVLSSPCSAATIFLRFIVTVRRGNNIFAFYRHRAARERYFCRFSACCAPANTFPNGFDVCSPTASVQKCGENRAGMAAGLVQRGK